ncbi:hypothetical protein BgiMline_004949, partial [Biomphalaria glabrata]
VKLKTGQDDDPYSRSYCHHPLLRPHRSCGHLGIQEDQEWGQHHRDGGGDAGWPKHRTYHRNIYYDCYLGRRRLHQRNCGDDHAQWAAVLPSTSWLRSQPRFWYAK